MIINPNKNPLEEQKRIKALKAKRPLTYMEAQYARAEAEANKIKNHNEQMLKQMKEKK
tara:strand:- start:131 stop:304 length:174 start_codon:yes stop_codon:yes gene_type:complete